MHETVTWGHYGDRLQRVSDFIHTHLGEDLDLDQIAEVACLSPWRWHRVYRQIYGETIASAVRRLRLHHASGDLLKTDLALAEVAKRAGYPNLRSFVRAFREAYGATPAQVRRDGG